MWTPLIIIQFWCFKVPKYDGRGIMRAVFLVLGCFIPLLLRMTPHEYPGDTYDYSDMVLKWLETIQFCTKVSISEQLIGLTFNNVKTEMNLLVTQ